MLARTSSLSVALKVFDFFPLSGGELLSEEPLEDTAPPPPDSSFDGVVTILGMPRSRWWFARFRLAATGKGKFRARPEGWLEIKRMCRGFPTGGSFRRQDKDGFDPNRRCKEIMNGTLSG